MLTNPYIALIRLTRRALALLNASLKVRNPFAAALKIPQVNSDTTTANIVKMPSKTASNAGGAGNLGQEHNNFVDDYLADWDDDPFRSPSPDPVKNDKPTEKKADVLGIEKELDLKKKPRAPRVKLDETRWVTLAFRTCIHVDSGAGCSPIKEFPNLGKWLRRSDLRARDTR